ncbi:Gfo/Idh/MocA family oxidoreductase [bacterium]|nr:MAG: Gfo/Idh/MocA family oxidoreductase [bacterium]
MQSPKRYAIVGLGSRSQMFSSALLKDYTEQGELVAFCDLNQTRMNYYNARYKERFGIADIPTFKSDEFDCMISQQRVDTVIVTTIDRTHHHYIIRALEMGCDVISEKPMTTDAEKCQQILDAVKRTGRKLTVTFNYRYSPRNSKVKELLQSGVIGEVISVHFEWLLDTVHGADYFRRWHRDKANSGGLMVHKSTHHFDLVNWWLDSTPQTVFGMGSLRFYGRENAEKRGVTEFYERAHGNPNAEGDPFALHLDKNEGLKKMYLEAEHEDGYIRDRSVFSDGISIEDDMSVLVRYNSGATMTYHLTAYSPWEGYRVAFNGTKGRLEYEVTENPYVSGSDKDTNRPDIRDAKEVDVHEPARILIRPLHSKPLQIEVTSDEGGHGGGDQRLLDDIFKPSDEVDPLGRAADHTSGAMSILTGIAANQSFATGMPVKVADLVQI